MKAAAELSALDPLSRFNAGSKFLRALRDLGRARAGAWLERHMPCKTSSSLLPEMTNETRKSEWAQG
jgi:hypothetical protein